MRKRVMLVLMGLALTALVLAVPEAMAKSQNHQGKDTTTPTQHSQHQSKDATTTSTTNQARHQSTVTITPKTISFGGVMVNGGIEPRPFTITNNGTMARQVKVSGIKGNKGGVFSSTSELPIVTTLGPGGTLPLTFIFAPTKLGKQKATFVVTIGKAKKTVTLSGTGAPEEIL
jgi:hypothetical protein